MSLVLYKRSFSRLWHLSSALHRQISTGARYRSCFNRIHPSKCIQRNMTIKMYKQQRAPCADSACCLDRWGCGPVPSISLCSWSFVPYCWSFYSFCPSKSLENQVFFTSLEIKRTTKKGFKTLTFMRMGPAGQQCRVRTFPQYRLQSICRLNVTLFASLHVKCRSRVAFALSV